jgi:hypothetical protein
MPITAITMENFKGIATPVRVEFKPITLLFGPNSAGKSTIFQALHYAREIFERQNLNPDKTLLGGDVMDLGGFEFLVYQHDLTLPIRLRLDFDLAGEDLPSYLPDDSETQNSFWPFDAVKKGWVQIIVKWNQLLEKPLVTAYETGLDDHPITHINCSDDGKQVFISFLNFDHPLFADDPALPIEEQVNHLEEIVQTGLDLFEEISFSGNKLFIPLDMQQSVLPVWDSKLHFFEGTKTAADAEQQIFYRNQAVEWLSTAIVGPGEFIQNELRRLCYVGPLREVPKRGHMPVTSPEESRWSNGLAAYDALFFSDNGLINKVNVWLTHKDRLNAGYSVAVKQYRELDLNSPFMLAVLQDRLLDEDLNPRDSILNLPVKHRLLIRDEARNLELTPQDIGVGISQVLPVVVAALYHNCGMVAMEQPELHIHPAFQVALGDLFIEKIHDCSDLTFLLETHSEHLMLRFLRRIRETNENEAPSQLTLTPDDLSIYFIEQGESGIVCYPIRVDEEGDFIDRWPRGFFSERAEELF